MARRSTPLVRASVVLHGLALDSARYTAKLDGVRLKLTAIEFKLLFALLVHPGWVLSRAQLIEIIYPEAHGINDRAVDSHVKNLRRKLRAIRPDSHLIQSVYGIGYKLNGSL